MYKPSWRIRSAVGCLSLVAVSLAAPSQLVGAVSTHGLAASSLAQGSTCTPLISLGSSADQYGGTTTTFELPGGETTSHREPPATMNLAEQSPSVLTFYGYPQPPTTDTPQYSQWMAEIAAPRSPFSPCIAPDVAAASIPGPTSAPTQQWQIAGPTTAYADSGNWSGALAQSQTNYPADQIEGSYYQTGYANTCGFGAGEASWVGLGGYNTIGGYQRLVQTGTGTNNDYQIDNNNNYAFYEWLISNTQGQQDGSLGEVRYNQNEAPVAPGDELIPSLVVDYDRDTVDYSLYDVTQNLTYTATGPIDSNNQNLGSFVDGTTAEWIDEAPLEYTDAQGDLAEYPLRTWYNRNIAWTYPADGGYFNITLYNVGLGEGGFAAPSNNWLQMKATGDQPMTQGLTGVTSDQWTNSWNQCTGTGGDGSGGTTLSFGYLHVDERIYSPNLQYSLVMQYAGNLVEYGPQGAVWATPTSGANNYTAMQGDGNLVVYNSNGVALWQSNTGGHPSGDYVLVLQNDGNLVIFNPSGSPIWSNGGIQTELVQHYLYPGQMIESPNRLYQLDMQNDGNLVEYYYPNIVKWATETNQFQNVGYDVAQQGDGNMVIYGAGGVSVWQSGSGGHSSADYALKVANTGEVAIYSPSGTKIWSNGV